MSNERVQAPELDVVQWFNTPEPLQLARLRGRVVVLHAFQMLCPGCVAHGLPQAQSVHDLFSARGVSVIGLHTVFEHHQVMQAPALVAFLHEYRFSFPVGVDRPSTGDGVPMTMRAYRLRGTPSLVVIDRSGYVRQSAFGRVDDLALGALIGSLLAEEGGISAAAASGEVGAGNCDDESCRHPAARLPE